MTLEDTLIAEIKQGKDFSLERALLIASGLQTEEEIAAYVRKIDQIQEYFHRYVKRLPSHKRLFHSKARLLFDFFWESKPKRYLEEKNLLTENIDAQLSGNSEEPVGNCYGLTALYTVIGAREGLDLSFAVFLADYFSPHINNKYRRGYIENTSKDGYDLPPSFFTQKGFDLQREGGNLLLLSDAFNNAGFLKHKSGNYEEAINLCTKALMLDPLNQQALIGRGLAKVYLGDTEGGIQDINEAISINPKSAVPYTALGSLKEHLGDFAGAIQCYNTAIKLAPKYSDAYFNRGVAKKNLGDLEGALIDLAKATELDPLLIRGYHHSAEIKIVIGDMEGAAQDYSKIIEIAPRDSVPFANRGAVRFYLGDLFGAVSDFKEALKLDPNSNANFNLNRVFYELQKKSADIVLTLK